MVILMKIKNTTLNYLNIINRFKKVRKEMYEGIES